MLIRVGAGALLLSAMIGRAALAADVPPPPPFPSLDPHDRALALELKRMWTIHPEELVTVIGAAARNEPAAPPLSLLLAIAHAETSGDVLDVSEAGAVGLAQATPVALRQEGIEGKLFVTADYLAGARAYILKKPLHDVEVIAADVLDDPDSEAAWTDAKTLLQSALGLRRESVDELELLSPWADDAFRDAVRSDDARNLELLTRLGEALEARDKRALRKLRESTHDAYRASLARQQESWKRYQLDLAARRDVLLEQRFQTRANLARKQHSYEAGEFLASELDVRFSPTRMAEFLVRHLERKAVEAGHLASEEKREEMTAALYNGGAHNVKRMLAGLISYLPETENYMRKVPAMRRRLDEATAGFAAAPVARGEVVETPFR